MLHLSIAAITIKIFTEGFHDQQENFTRISGKGKQRTKSEEEVCIRFKSGKGNGKKNMEKSEISSSICALLQTEKRADRYFKSQCQETSTDNAHYFTLYLNYTSRKVMLINSLMYEGNIQISEYEGTYLTLI